MSEIVLRYVNPNAYAPGVPACDLTREMIEATGYTEDEILAFGGASPLYVRAIAAEAKE